MIYYILLVIAALLFASQFMVQKGYEKSRGKTIKSALVFTIAEGLCAGFIFFALNGFKFEMNSYVLIISLIIGINISVSIIAGIKVMSMGSLQVYTLFLMLGGLILPFLYGVIFLEEDLSIFKIIGLILLIVAIFLPVLIKKHKEEKEESKGNKTAFYILCVVLFILNGLNTILCKVHQLSEYAVSTQMFTASYFFLASVVGTICLLSIFVYEKIKGIDDKDTYKAIIHPVSLFFGFLFALVNGTGCFLNTYAAKYINAVAQYPIITGGTMVFSAILALIIYKEKLKTVQKIELLLSLIATLLFMF